MTAKLNWDKHIEQTRESLGFKIGFERYMPAVWGIFNQMLMDIQVAQNTTPEQKKSATEIANLVAYLRHYHLWEPDCNDKSQGTSNSNEPVA